MDGHHRYQFIKDNYYVTSNEPKIFGQMMLSKIKPISQNMITFDGNHMKKYLLISLAVLSSMPLMANSEFEIQSIKTVEDVQMVRNRLIDRMTEILASGKLTDEAIETLTKVAAEVSAKFE